MKFGTFKFIEIGKKKRTYRIKEQIKFAKKLTIEHLFYTISIATNKRTFFKRLWISGHPSSGCDEIRNEFIKAMGYSCQWILSAFGTNDYQHEEVSCIMTSKKRSSMVKETKGSVAHCSRSQDIALFKFQLSYHSNPLQDTCPITSAVLGHLIRTRVPLMFLNWDKKSYQLCEKCATL